MNGMQETEIGLMPEEWEEYSFPSTIVKSKAGKKNQINASEFKKTGKYPVIDQGQKYIAGFSDAEDKVFMSETPVVVFGDHTRCFKYVDFPFIIGADGTKILTPKTDLFVPKFFYFYLVFLNIPSKGYNRHYKLLQEQKVLCPPLPEQRNIAHVLALIQRAIATQAELIRTTTELKKALMQKVFTEGLSGEAQKETEIGLIPESWEVVELGSLAKIGNGSTPKRDKRGYWDGGSIPWLTSGKIHERFIEKADEFVTDLAVKECHLPSVRANSLLIAITGQGKTLGNSALVKFETCISQHLAYVQFHTEKVIPEFMLWYLQTRYQHLRSISQAGGSTKGALTCGYIKKYPVLLPSKEEQNQIAKICATLHKKERNHERRKLMLEELFRTLLNKLMTGQIRVQHINFNREGAQNDRHPNSRYAPSSHTIHRVVAWCVT